MIILRGQRVGRGLWATNEDILTWAEAVVRTTFCTMVARGRICCLVVLGLIVDAGQCLVVQATAIHRSPPAHSRLQPLTMAGRNPAWPAEKLAAYDESLAMEKRGVSPEEIEAYVTGRARAWAIAQRDHPSKPNEDEDSATPPDVVPPDGYVWSPTVF